VREPLDTPRMAGGNFVAATRRTEGSGKLGNITESCISGLLSCKAGATYGSRTIIEALEGYHRISTLTFLYGEDSNRVG
jgi:hypothetical protein